jgi:hypothetical protein
VTPTARRRRPSGRARAHSHVAPVLDPTWRSPYVPSAEERTENRRALRVTTFARVRPYLLGAATLLTAGVVLSVVGLFVTALSGWWWPLLGVVGVLTALSYHEWRCRQLEAGVLQLAAVLRASFQPGGTPLEAERLKTIAARLTATFGLSDVEVVIVADDGYNAALLPSPGALVLLVTSALARDFTLVEIEGVVAHLMARERLGTIEREAAASLARWGGDATRELAGPASAYRADEVAAAGTRYPQGLASALSKCASNPPPSTSFFRSPAYAQTRWIWFDRYADKASPFPDDLDDVTVRARALAEW